MSVDTQRGGVQMVNEYDGEWITTYTGIKFHFRNPAPEEISLVDIAHHSSLLCRFTGACNVFYSVGEHALRVAGLVPEGLKFQALLHDGAEPYMNDISRPVKYSHKLEETEKIILDAIGKKFGITFGDPIVKEADDILLATEARDLGLNNG